MLYVLTIMLYVFTMLYVLTMLYVYAYVYVDFSVSKAEFPQVYNIDGGIHAYALEADASVGTY